MTPQKQEQRQRQRQEQRSTLATTARMGHPGARRRDAMTMDIRNIGADFYLRLDEGEGAPRACWFKKRLRDAVRDDWMLVSIEPPVIGQPYGLGSEDIYHLLLSTRFKGQTLFPVSEWPSHVYVARMQDKQIPDEQDFDSTQTQLIGWGTLCRTLDDSAVGN